MKKEGNANNWDNYENYLPWDKFQNEGICELRRKYGKNGIFLEQYISYPDLAPIVAKGISAFLSYYNRQNSPSYLSLIKHGSEIDFKDIRLQYFSRCFKFLSDKEKRNPDEEDRKSEIELILIHIKSEEEYFQESDKLFTEVKEEDESAIGYIKKAASRYPEWVKENKIAKEAPDTSRNQEEKNVNLADIFDSIPKYNFIMNLLIEKDYCEAGTNIWKNKESGYKGLICALIKDIEAKGYLKKDISMSWDLCRLISFNSFKVKITGNKTYYDASLEPTMRNFIPLASTIE